MRESFDSGSPAKLGSPLTSAVTPRLAVICDLLEENWPSMDLVAEMVVATLERSEGFGVQASRVRPDMVRRFSGVRLFRNMRLAVNADRFLNRFWDYPRSLGGLSHAYDLFHIVDHSYAHLVHALPPHRTIVTCHDLDAFRCLVEPDGERRGLPYKKMAARILSGLRKAAHVTCDSAATRDELLRYRLVPPDRLSVISLGVHPVFRRGRTRRRMRRPPGYSVRRATRRPTSCTWEAPSRERGSSRCCDSSRRYGRSTPGPGS